MSEPTTFTQTAHHNIIQLVLHNSYFEYSISPRVSGSGTRVMVDYDSLPDPLDHHVISSRQDVGMMLLALTTLSAGYFFFVVPWLDYYRVQTAWYIPIIFLILIAITLPRVYCDFRNKYQTFYYSIHTLIPLDKEKYVLVFHDKQHDQILLQLAERRKHALRKLAHIDIALAPAWQIKRLRWLHEQQIITDKELFILEEEAHKTFHDFAFTKFNIVKTTAPLSSSVAFSQRSNLNHYSFIFHDQYLQYTANNRAFNIRYDLLPPILSRQEVRNSDPFGAFVFVIIGIIGLLANIGLMSQKAARQHDYYLSTDGILSIVGTIAAATLIWAATYICYRLSNTAVTKLQTEKGTLFIAHDSQKDAILDELSKRRMAALRQMAVLDDINTQQEELQKFHWLHAAGALTDLEYAAFKERIVNTTPNKTNPPESQKIVLN